MIDINNIEQLIKEEKKILRTKSKNYRENFSKIKNFIEKKIVQMEYLKKNNQNLKVSQWFLDPLSRNGPDYINNKKRILDKIKFIDATFLTSDPKSLDFKIKNSYFIPNPADISFETLNNSKNKPQNDVFFAMSHGVHRGNLKSGKYDDREEILKKLLKIKDIKFDFYGINNIQPIWGNEFLKKLSNQYLE